MPVTVPPEKIRGGQTHTVLYLGPTHIQGPFRIQEGVLRAPSDRGRAPEAVSAAHETPYTLVQNSLPRNEKRRRDGGGAMEAERAWPGGRGAGGRR